MAVRIHIGDCRQVLKTLPAESVHCVVTSPPYYGLRDYGVAGQLGLEQSPDEYLETMVEVFREVRRVLRHDGTAWVNMGDSYSSGGRGGNPTEETSGLQGGQASQRASMSSRFRVTDLPPKNVMGMPWRLAFALQADGWILRQDIVWAKPNPMPESVRDRCTKSHEYLFLLAKSEKYYFDQESILEPCSPNTHARLSQDVQNQIGSDRVPGKTNGRMKAVGRGSTGVGFGHGTDKDARKRERVTERKLAEAGSGTKNNSSFDNAMAIMPENRNKRSVWNVTTQPFKEAHFATFPPALVEPCILAGSPRGGVILDPFGGAGTTGLVADRLQRDAILIELNPEYAAIAERRIRKEAPVLTDVQLITEASTC
jgi:DNA modification methylase